MAITPLPYEMTGNFNQPPLCPDLLSIRNLGAADGWRGKSVRAFFRVLKWTTGV